MAKVLAKNKRAYFDYEIIDTIEAGIVLTGGEVKSVKNGQISLRDSFVKILNGEAFLWNASISKYKYATTVKDYDPLRQRKLLLSKKQIQKLDAKSSQSRYSIVPLKVLLSHGLVKIVIGLVRGLKQYDKREKEKKRAVKREIDRKKKQFML